MHRTAFGDEFVWGVSTAAYQIEGAHEADGKGKSIWDEFSRKSGKIRDQEHADITCDFYNKYVDDIQLMKTMNISHYRFSISWTRILPDGVGQVNPLGVQFYNNVINECLKQGITPWVTLYHWDLPQVLEDRGGWTNREVLGWFEEFATVCLNNFGDRIKHWMVLNEPVVFTGAGYFFGKHAPGKWGLRHFLPAVHHVTLSMGRIGRLIRKMCPEAVIGTTFSHSPLEPISLKKRHIKALRRADAIVNRLFIEPILGLGYPLDAVRSLKAIKKYILPGDEEAMPFDFDFIGLQTYTREFIQFSLLMPYIWANIVEPKKRGVTKTTLMNWEIYPPALFDALRRLSSYPKIPPIYVTENGAAFEDILEDGKVNDVERRTYLQDHIAQVLKAKQLGVNVKGYFVWTFTDNFEWAEGYHPRFGLVYIDFKTQQRIVKESGKWYAEWLADS
ncbi:beta-glucosidase [Olivibacter sp. SDN3]|uniref:GH1 family beta-glucosidase n=1 Tax=Olivibacter sp. SDN3 TaxID=2764720 RepID=UPI0016518B82|nr:GH1 family beta-glucosidase [Olivibacter sp. SDN3]QNL49471.1 beta-glucosidase [Olivibacter sp. SDN3]